MEIHDHRKCALGEGPLWHPQREELYWFDILGKMLHRRGISWQFDEHVSAAGWIDWQNLLIASETGLYRFNVETSAKELIVGLEADNPITRSNDGRADPWGGFWIGTMGCNTEPDAGAIYRFYRGELRKLYAPITISNAICFTPDGSHAYFTDTASKGIKRVTLNDADGWPKGEPETVIDLRSGNLNPDGAVIDAEGRFWNAQWGAGCVTCYADGKPVERVNLPASQITCPAFGGNDLDILYATSAAVGLDEPDAGKTFRISLGIKGQKEHQVIL